MQAQVNEPLVINFRKLSQYLSALKNHISNNFLQGKIYPLLNMLSYCLYFKRKIGQFNDQMIESILIKLNKLYDNSENTQAILNFVDHLFTNNLHQKPNFVKAKNSASRRTCWEALVNQAVKSGQLPQEYQLLTQDSHTADRKFTSSPVGRKGINWSLNEVAPKLYAAAGPSHTNKHTRDSVEKFLRMLVCSELNITTIFSLIDYQAPCAKNDINYIELCKKPMQIGEYQFRTIQEGNQYFMEITNAAGFAKKIKWINIPIRDGHAIIFDYYQALEIESNINSDAGDTLVHCHSGVGRTALLWCAYKWKIVLSEHYELVTQLVSKEDLISPEILSQLLALFTQELLTARQIRYSLPDLGQILMTVINSLLNTLYLLYIKPYLGTQNKMQFAENYWSMMGYILKKEIEGARTETSETTAKGKFPAILGSVKSLFFNLSPEEQKKQFHILGALPRRDKILLTAIGNLVCEYSRERQSNGFGYVYSDSYYQAEDLLKTLQKIYCSYYDKFYHALMNQEPEAIYYLEQCQQQIFSLLNSNNIRIFSKNPRHKEIIEQYLAGLDYSISKEVEKKSVPLLYARS